MKRTVIAFVMVLSILILGCSEQAAKRAVTENPSPELSEAEPAEVPAAEPGPTGALVAEPEPAEAAVQEPEPEQTVRELSITAKQWDFVPEHIEANKGDLVRLKLKSVDVLHGFSLRSFGINERLEPGKEVVVEFIADRVGKFEFYCNIPCGSGHSGMRGKLIITE